MGEMRGCSLLLQGEPSALKTPHLRADCPFRSLDSVKASSVSTHQQVNDPGSGAVQGRRGCPLESRTTVPHKGSQSN